MTSNHLPSPQKRRFDTISGHHTSPVALKKARASQNQEEAALLPPFELITNSLQCGQLFTIGDIQTNSGINTSTTRAPNIDAERKILDAETHANRLAIAAQMTAGKGTESAYARHMKNYYEFWEADQAERLRLDPFRKFVPPEPITIGNVALFLQYETTRTKV